MTKIHLMVTLFFSVAFVYASYAKTTVDIRLSHNTLVAEQKALYVDIEVKANENMVLAGQNYRVYYPSALVSIDTKGSSSKLSQKDYSELKFSNILEHIKSDVSGELDFDQDLGFVNFYVDLLNIKEGGKALKNSDGWIKLATLKFDLLEDAQALEMIWGREGKSENYATAFVQIAEWQESSITRDVDIDTYIDYKYAPESINIPEVLYVKVGPNPTIDEVHIMLNQASKNDVNVDIQDVSGKLVKRLSLAAGIKNHTIDVSDLQSAPYLFVMTDSDSHQMIHNQKLVVTQ